MRSSSWHDLLSATAIVLLVLFFWECGVCLAHTPTYLLPPPSLIFKQLFHDPFYYVSALWVTLGEAAAGLICGVVGGVSVAVGVTVFPRLERGMITIAILIKSMPLAAIAPLLTIWLGFGVLPKVIITALLTFFPVLVNVLVGLQNPEQEMLDLMRVHGASTWQILRHLRSWNALPYLFAALRVAVPLSLMGAVIAEWTGATSGLGRVMWLAYANLNLPPLFAAIFIISAASVIFYLFTVYVERISMPWRNNPVN